jgi:hypothetical protein
LRTDEEVNHESDNAGDHDKDHPQHGVIHAAVLSVLGDPNQEQDVQSQGSDDDETEKSETTASGCTAGSVISLNVNGKN